MVFLYEHRFTIRTFLLFFLLVWLNGWVFVYELSVCGFESHCNLNYALKLGINTLMVFHVREK